jgi:OOP family OmpA-OmpF porin
VKDSDVRRRLPVVSITTILVLAGFFALFFTITRAAPEADLASRVQLVVPNGISVRTSDGTVFLSGEFDGDVGMLIADVAAVDGAVLVVADDVHPIRSTTTPTSTPLTTELGQPSLHLAVSRDSVEIAGTVSSSEIARDIELAAQNVFGSRRVRSQLQAGLVDEAPWVSGLPSAMEAADNARVGNFELDITIDGATVSGVAPDQESVDKLLADLRFALGFVPVSSIDVRDLSAQLTALLRGITTFETGSAQLSEEGKMVLDEAASLLLENGDGLMRVVGHTDSVGDRQANQILSEQRAQAVVDYLVAKGVAVEQLRAIGFGDTRPIASNDTDEGRAQNRRIEFVVGG